MSRDDGDDDTMMQCSFSVFLTARDSQTLLVVHRIEVSLTLAGSLDLSAIARKWTEEFLLPF